MCPHFQIKNGMCPHFQCVPIFNLNFVKCRLLSPIRFALIREKGVERSLKKSQRLDNIWKPKYYSLQRG